MHDLYILLYLFYCLSIKDESVVLGFEKLHGVLSCHSLCNTNSIFASSSLAHSLAGLLKNYIKVHSENTSVGVILNAQVNMLLNTEPEVS